MSTTISNSINNSWREFIETDEVTGSIVPQMVLESWKRSIRYGIDPYGSISPIRLSSNEIVQKMRENEIMIKAAKPFIELLKVAVKGSGFSITLANKEGYVLGVSGDREILKMAQENNYLPGCRRTEDEVGTNAIGLTLVLKKPVQLTGAEHFNSNFHQWTCSSAPIFSHRKDLLGIITLSGKSKDAHIHTFGLVVAASEGIENKIVEYQVAQDRDRLNHYLNSIFNSISEGIIAIDLKGHVVRYNQIAKKMISLIDKKVIGKCLNNAVRIQQEVWLEILNGEPFSNKEICINISNKPHYFICSITPIGNKADPIGKILILKESHQVRHLVQRLTGNTAKFVFSDIIGQTSEIIEQIRISKVASKSNSRVLIIGESGTGKELFAQAIHNESLCKNGPFLAINCAAVPRELIEAELFGYREGAFTGARKGGVVGKFELADQGTLFLDEISSMPLDMQTKLLRVIETEQITRLGDTLPRLIDVRLVAASNQDLLEKIRNGEFREDLYYRLNVVEISIPPLRNRMKDLRILVEYILDKLCFQLNFIMRKNISVTAYKLLFSYQWPGNVRELENYLERACHLCQENLILPKHLPRGLYEKDQKPLQTATTIPEAEKNMILLALSECNGNKSQAAQLLKISRSTLHRRLKTYQIENSTII